MKRVKEYTIKITLQAIKQLREIERYIAKELFAPEAAQNTINIIKDSIKSLSIMPERIKITEEKKWKKEKIRRMHIKNYYVYFWIDKIHNIVQIIAVIYVMRDQIDQLENSCLEELNHK